MQDRLEEIKRYWNDNGAKDIYVMAEVAESDIPYLLRRQEAAEAVIAAQGDFSKSRTLQAVAAWEKAKAEAGGEDEP